MSWNCVVRINHPVSPGDEEESNCHKDNLLWRRRIPIPCFERSLGRHGHVEWRGEEQERYEAALRLIGITFHGC